MKKKIKYAYKIVEKGEGMITIAICDENVKKGKQLERWLKTWFFERRKLYKSYNYLSGKKLLFELQDGLNLDIILMDIMLPGINGSELIDEINIRLPEALIIFITAREEYVYESFRMNPYRFIPQKYMSKMLSLAIEDAVRHIEENEKKCYLLENRKGLERIPIRNIMYIWRKEKYAYLEIEDGRNTKVRKTLKQVYQELEEEDFVWAHRGCICNLNYIMKVQRESILLKNGIQIFITKEKSVELKKLLWVIT